MVKSKGLDKLYILITIVVIIITILITLYPLESYYVYIRNRILQGAPIESSGKMTLNHFSNRILKDNRRKFSDKQKINNGNIEEGFATFTRCKSRKLTKNLEYTFQKGNIHRVGSEGSNWDIYLPCGYNNVESELETINISNQNQKIFGIKGCDFIVSKNSLWHLLQKKFGRQQASTIMPETYILSNEDDMQVFKQNYSPDKLYLLKKNIQRKKGIEITHDYNVIMKAKADNYKVVQEYVPDLYLINNRKINLRIYLLITCHKGVIKGYLHKQGKCIYTNKEYGGNMKNINSSVIDPEEHLTSLNLDIAIYNNNPESFEDLKKHMGFFNYYTLDKNIQYSMKKVMEAAEGSICKSKKLDNNVSFQLFGADVIFTKNLHPYILELNKGPQMGYKTGKDEKMKKKVTYDIFSLVGLVPKETNMIGKNKNGFYQIW